MNGKLLFDLAAQLSPRFAHERSFAVRPGGIFADRFLLSLSMAEIVGGVSERILGACAQMNMPSVQIQLIRQYLPTTHFLHLAFEAAKKEKFYKLYLEQDTPPAPSSRKAILQYLGCKWDISN